MAPKKSASWSGALGVFPVVQFPLAFQLPLPLTAHCAMVGGVPAPSRSASSTNAACWPVTVDPPTKSKLTCTCVAPAGAIPLTLYWIHAPVVVTEVAGMSVSLEKPLALGLTTDPDAFR